MARTYGPGSVYVRNNKGESKEARQFNLDRANEDIERRRRNKSATGSNAKPKPTGSATGSATGRGGKDTLRSAANKLTRAAKAPLRVAKAPFSMVRKAGAYAIPAMIAGYVGEELKNTPGAVAARKALGDATNEVMGLFGGMSNDDLSKSLRSDDPEKKAAAQAEAERRRDDPRFYEPGGGLANIVDNYYGSSDDEITFNAGTLNALGDGWDALVGAIDPETSEPVAEEPVSALSEAQNSMLQGDYPYLQGDKVTPYGVDYNNNKPPKLGFSDRSDAAPVQGENMIQSANGFMQIPPNDPNGSALAARVNTGEPGDAAYALEQGAMANAIRQRSIDENRGSGITIVGDSSQRGPTLEDVQNRILQNSKALASGMGSARDLNRLYRENESLENLATSMTNQAGYEQRADMLGYGADLDYESDYLDREQERAADNATLSLAEREEARRELESRLGQEPSVADVLKLFEGGPPNRALLEGLYKGTDNPQLMDIFESYLAQDTNANNYSGGLIEQYAGGGMVPPNVGGQGMPRQGTDVMGGQQRSMPTQADIANYQQYSAKAQEMGLASIGFDEYLSMKAPTENFAAGGMVPSAPDAAGKMLIDPDPQAGVDSIPAVIDGNRPAKMNSGEFVIPTDVVLFYGTDKLTKMIEKARVTGEPDNANSAIAGATGA